MSERERAEIARLERERDALRVQVEAVRALAETWDGDEFDWIYAPDGARDIRRALSSSEPVTAGEQP